MDQNQGNFDELNAKTKQIRIALKYTDGNLERAKSMAAGQFNDAVMLKGRFALEEKKQYGIFYLVINVEKNFVINVSILLLGDSAIYDKIRVFDEWNIFYQEFGKAADQSIGRSIDSHEFSEHLADSVDGYDLYYDVKSGNIDLLSDTITEIIQKFYSTKNVNCQLAFSSTSSLALELAGISLAQTAESEGVSESDADDEAMVSEMEKKHKDLESQAALVLDAQVIVSPVKGKFVNSLEEGDVIYVLPLRKDDKSIKLARSLNLMKEDGDFLPMPARLKSRDPVEDGKGCILYASIAKNVLARILEEENVKVAIESRSAVEEAKAQSNSGTRLIILLALLFGIIFIAVLLIVFLV